MAEGPTILKGALLFGWGWEAIVVSRIIQLVGWGHWIGPDISGLPPLFEIGQLLR
jgi:hypothetical protein